MILCALTGSLREILLILIMALGAIFWIVYAVRFSKAIDKGVDSLLNPLLNLPEEISIEIVRDDPQDRPSACQNAPSVPPVSEQA